MTTFTQAQENADRAIKAAHAGDHAERDVFAALAAAGYRKAGYRKLAKLMRDMIGS